MLQAILTFWIAKKVFAVIFRWVFTKTFIVLLLLTVGSYIAFA